VRLPDDNLEALARLVVEQLREKSATPRPLLDVAWQLERLADLRGYPKVRDELHDAIKDAEAP
jgi:hypothetical protein